jgi:hypothetical protein
LHELEDLIEQALTDARVSEEERERARDKIGLGNCPFGLPFTVLPCRLYLGSRSRTVDLRQLHQKGILDLYAAAGLLSSCGGVTLDAGSFKDFGFAFSNAPARWEVVYAGTNTPVSPSDLRRYLSEGPNAVPEFRVYSMRKGVFERYLKFAKRKVYTIGIDLFWDGVQDLE